MGGKGIETPTEAPETPTETPETPTKPVAAAAEGTASLKENTAFTKDYFQTITQSIETMHCIPKERGPQSYI